MGPAERALMPEQGDWPAPDPAQILATISQAVLVTDAAGIISTWNPGAEALFGWSALEAIGQSGRGLLMSVVLDQDVDQITAELLGGRACSGALTTLHRDGSALRVGFTASPLLDPAGRLTGAVFVATGLHATVAPLLENCREAVLIVGADGMIHFASPSVLLHFGWQSEALVATAALLLVHPQDRDRAAAMGRHCIEATAPRQQELRVQGRDGRWRWANVSVTNLLLDPGVRALVVHLHDITERRAAAERLRYLREHDALTGLLNRDSLVDRLQDGRPDRGQAGALLLVQVDSAALLTDRVGHTGADEVQRTVALRLAGTLGPLDSCGSDGAGAFLVLAETVDSAATLAALADRIQLALGRGIPAAGRLCTPQVSIGSSLLAGRRRGHELLAEATAAMQEAQASGPGRCAQFGELLAPQAGDGQVHRLAQALRDGELVVHYQPVLHLIKRRVVAVEALLRWRHPEHGLLAAGAFLEQAEQSDLINDIGAYVLRQACAQVAAWPGEALTLAVNISARQLADRGLADQIDQVLAQTGLPPGRLVLEITETAVLQDLSAARATLARCRDRGIRVSIDDFGTGFAGYQYLRELPVDEIKVDRSFTAGLAAEGLDAAIVSGIIHLAHKLGVRTTAEGIETEEQARLLTELGCDQGQGYLWSAAQPGEQRPTLVGAVPVPAVG